MSVYVNFGLFTLHLLMQHLFLVSLLDLLRCPEAKSAQVQHHTAITCILFAIAIL